MDKMLVIRPNRCDTCTPAETCDSCIQGYHASAHIIQHARNQGWSVVDAAGDESKQTPVFNAIDQHNPGVIYGFGHGNNCYSEDTEILTEDGWKFFYDLKDEKVATLNNETGALEYHKPIHYFVFGYKGKMFYHKGRAIDLLVTPNHNLYVSWPTNQGIDFSPFQFLQPLDLDKKIKGRLHFKRDAIWNRVDTNFFILPSITYDHKNQYSDEVYKREICEKQIKMDDWLEFFGWWISEGCACLGFADKNKKYINYRVSLTQNNKNNREKIKKVIERLGYKYRESGNGHSMNLEIRDKQLYAYLKQFGHAGDKFIPKEIKQLSSRQLKILFDSLVAGDGADYGTRYSYTTKSKKLADDLQEICLKIGYAAILTQTKNSLYRLSIATDTNLNPLCRKNRGFIDYEGMIYCVEVPNNIIYVRRKGKPVWCGNSRFTTQNREDVWNIENCGNIQGRIIYLLSCLTANTLGPEMLKQGAVAYAGFNISWTWLAETDINNNFKHVDPYDDPFARGFYESSDELMVALSNGASFIEAVHASIQKYNDWIQYWYQTGGPASQDCIMWLAYDRDGLVALTTCEQQQTEQDCIDAGCIWENQMCRTLPAPKRLNPALLLPVAILVGLVFIVMKK